MASDKDFKTDITADPSKFDAGMRKAAQSAANASNSINAEFKKIGDMVGNVTKYIAGFTAVLAGGGALKKFISDANDWNTQAGKMSKQLGISTEQASVLNVALNHLGIESDIYTDAAMKMSKQIQGNAQAFEVLGVKTRDASGAYRPVTELMGEVNQKLLDIKNPIEQNIAGQQVYGKGWAEVRGILRLTKDGMDEAAVTAKRLGLIVGPEGVAMSRQYSAQMRDLNLVGKSLEMQFGNALLPVFTRIGKFMGEEAPAMGEVFAKVLEGIGFVAQVLWLRVKDLGDGLGALGARVVALLHGDLAAFKAIGKARDEEFARTNAKYDALKANFGKPLLAPASAAPDTGAGPRYKFKEKKEKEGTGGAEPGRMAEWEARLAADKAALEREGLLEGQYREMNKTQEQAYWDALLKRKDLSEQEKIALTRKTAEVEMAGIRQNFEVQVATLQAEAAAFKNNTDERMRIELQIQAKYQQGTKQYEEAAKKIVEIQRQAAEQERAVAETRQQVERDTALATIALEERALQTSEQLRQVTHKQVLQAQLAFENRRNQIALDAINRRIAIAKRDPDRNIVEIAKLNADKEALEREHQAKMAAIDDQIGLESSKGIIAAQDGIQSSFESMIEGLGNGTKTLKQAFTDLLSSVTAQIMKMIAQNLTQQLFNPVGAGGGGFGAMVSSGLKFLGSFDVGTAFVPADGLAQIHKGERIVTARDNASGNYGQGGVSVTNHFTISGPTDRRSQAQIAMAAMQGAMMAQRRNG